MTKYEEIQLLDATIAKFGPNSYIGPWLKCIRDTLVDNIRADFPIDFLLVPDAEWVITARRRDPFNGQPHCN